MIVEHDGYDIEGGFKFSLRLTPDEVQAIGKLYPYGPCSSIRNILLAKLAVITGTTGATEPAKKLDCVSN